MLKSIIAKIKKIFEIIGLMIKNPMVKLRPEADKIYQEFADSDVGKETLSVLKKEDKESLEKILSLLKSKVEELTKSNAKLTLVILEYLKDKIISGIK
jgi:hypothetical protein